MEKTAASHHLRSLAETVKTGETAPTGEKATANGEAAAHGEASSEDDTSHAYSLPYWENVVCNMVYNQNDPAKSEF
jgi:hypothetical protein